MKPHSGEFIKSSQVQKKKKKKKKKKRKKYLIIFKRDHILSLNA